MNYCYACKHYRSRIERVVYYDNATKKTKTKERSVERCAKRGNTELKIPVVMPDGTHELLLRSEYFGRIDNGSKEPGMIYGSEAQYRLTDCTEVVCESFEKQERKFYVSST